MAEEGKTVNDVQTLLSMDVPQGNLPESIIRAVEDLLRKNIRPNNENNAF